MAKHCSSAQRDLFEKPPQGTKLDNSERRKVVEQLRVLLTEAMTGVSGRQEMGDDKDHA